MHGENSEKYIPIYNIDAKEYECTDMTIVMKENEGNKKAVEKVEKYIEIQTNLAFFVFKTAKLLSEIKPVISLLFLD